MILYKDTFQVNCQIQKEEHCSTQAGNSSRDRPTAKLKVNGIFAYQCKHGLYRASGVADFPKGERSASNHICNQVEVTWETITGKTTFANEVHRFDIVDIPFQIQLESEWQKGIQKVLQIYDVACSFKKRAHERCVTNKFSPLSQEFHNRLQLVPENKKFIDWKVNVFHQYGHKAECADEHGLRHTKNVGKFTGEDIETGWARLNHCQYATREMDAGARVDSISAHMLHINKDKTEGLGE
jgi:hypothetical protein